jgi:hypothetical protein
MGGDNYSDSVHYRFFTNFSYIHVTTNTSTKLTEVNKHQSFLSREAESADISCLQQVLNTRSINSFKSSAPYRRQSGKGNIHLLEYDL